MDEAGVIRIFVDADACPVKDEVYRVAARYGLKTFIVANSFMQVPKDPMIERVIVGAGMDVADNWIAEHATPRDVVITADIPLAARCLDKQARVLGPNGKPFTADNIGMALAARDLSRHLRELTPGGQTHHAGFGKQDRSRFLGELENCIQALKRSK